MFRSFTGRRAFACFTAALLPVTVRLVLLLVTGFPEPTVHDEFSYLLAADTFAHGRLANPVHPMRHYFETYHELMTPTYVSKYPPAQGLFLALGQVVFGHPWFGVLLSFALMTACFCWMLQGWGPPWAAWLVAVAAGFHWALAPIPYGAGGHWMNSYWGGAVAAGAGALVLGAAPRLARRPGFSAALAASLGVAVLAISRPFEGFAFTLLALAGLLFWMRRSAALLRPAVLAPAVVLGAATLLFLGVYNHATTGSATTFAYLAYHEQYSRTPSFWILPPSPPKTYPYDEMRRFWEDVDLRRHNELRALPILVPIRLVMTVIPAWIAPAWLLPLLLGWGAGPKPARRFLGLVFGGSLLLWLLMKSVMFHYVAPIVGLALVIIAWGLRRLRVYLRTRPRLARATPRLVFATFLAGTLLVAFASLRPPLKGCDYGVDRHAILTRLAQEPGRHLVLVRYTPAYDTNDEWVFNAADIDTSPIVWARDNGGDKNQPLLDYYRERRVWLLEPGVSPPRLTALR